MSEPQEPTRHRRLISHDHRKRSLTAWIVPLIVVVAIIVLLPKVVGLLAR